MRYKICLFHAWYLYVSRCAHPLRSLLSCRLNSPGLSLFLPTPSRQHLRMVACHALRLLCCTHEIARDDNGTTIRGTVVFENDPTSLISNILVLTVVNAEKDTSRRHSWIDVRDIKLRFQRSFHASPPRTCRSRLLPSGEMLFHESKETIAWGQGYCWLSRSNMCRMVWLANLMEVNSRLPSIRYPALRRFIDTWGILIILQTKTRRLETGAVILTDM